QCVINSLDGADIMPHIRAYELRTLKRRRSFASYRPRCRSTASFFAILHCATPHFAERRIPSGERIVEVPLRKTQGSIVAQPLQLRLNAHLSVVGRTLRTPVEVNVKLDLQTSNIFFYACQMIFDRWPALRDISFGSGATFSSQTRQFAVFGCQRQVSLSE